MTENGDVNTVGEIVALITGAAAAATVLIATRRHRPPGRAGWYLLGAAVLAHAADALHVAQYPLIIAALASFLRRRTGRRPAPALLDAAVAATAAGLLAWVYLIGPTPAILAAFVLALALRLRPGGGAGLMLLAGLVAMFAGDIAHSLRGDAAATGAWLLAYALLAGAALHPGMRRVDDPAPVRAVSGPAARVVLLAAASLLAPVVLLVQYHRGDTRDVPVIAVACALLFLLVIARMAGLVADQHRLAVTDALTGLRTRRAFEERLRGRRPGRPVAVVLLDIDHFKRVNDAFGHPAGDAVLREVACRLRAQAGPEVTVARYGGEEFALLVPNASGADAAGLAERLRAAVGADPVDLGGGVLRDVTVSGGTAVLPADTAEPDELVLLADRALYAAKRAGRDRVVSADRIPAVSALTGPGRATEGEEWPVPLPRPRRSELEAA
ncbi:GGDEF domain-containing protein [Dactylosporangium sp. CA-092794]|uniref:GGDEF domain-containing protein n=1 Tax=Dactylosporangium sp. CA-092794 TaxID=3239929 RepID=UPI003D945F08